MIMHKNTQPHKAPIDIPTMTPILIESEDFELLELILSTDTSS